MAAKKEEVTLAVVLNEIKNMASDITETKAGVQRINGGMRALEIRVSASEGQCSKVCEFNEKRFTSLFALKDRIWVYMGATSAVCTGVGFILGRYLG
ncbi:hypothetical protein M0R72_06715 [Candidatus Pacearchaeota archaeon]|jgi:hypothetical protein|nr:hypothetical protein [Candidatus Pacearchaeota archaeon]